MNSKIVQAVLYFILMNSATFALANIIEYGQKLNEANWAVETTTKSCKLRQHIPLYGIAEFEQLYRDAELIFNIYIDRIPEKNISAKLSSVPADWNHVTLLRPLAKVTINNMKKAISLDHKLSMRVISELEDGMFPTLSYQDWLDKQDNIKVAISPIKFRDHLPDFLFCIAKLPLKPVIIVKSKSDRQAVKDKKLIKISNINKNIDPYTVYFGKNSSTLNSKSKKQLRSLAKILKKNISKKHIIISGYSDNVGSRTQSITLSKQRATNVQLYLEKRGIAAKFLFTRYFGRDHAILSNNTETGRARNRRVHIDVLKLNLKEQR